jgi:hypothetical protein
MVGKPGRSGRPKGSTSWWRNPTALAGRHLNMLIEMWLAGVPIEVENICSDAPKRWLVQPTKRQHTVPKEIKRVLAIMAVGHVMDMYSLRGRPTVAAVLAWSRRQAPSVTLRRPARTKPRDETESAYQKYLEDLTTAWKK